MSERGIPAGVRPERSAPPDGDADPRSVAQLRMLHSLATRINLLNDVRAIGEAITAELRTLVDYHNCRVFQLQSDGETLVPIAFRGQMREYQVETFDALVTRVGRGITGHVASTGSSYYSRDAGNDPFGVRISGTFEIEESVLAVPMKHGERVIGVVVLSKLGLDQFDRDDLRVLELLASYAAVAMENAGLLEREREAAVRAGESEARTSAILESALDCIVAMDHEGRIVEFNPAAERTFGHARADAIGRDMADLIIPPALRAQHRRGLARYLATGEAPVLGSRLELTAVRADGTEFPVELAITLVDLPGPALFTGTIRDITDRKHAEQEIERAVETEREASRRLRALDEMKNTFLQAVSHDLRTPLAAVLGLAVTLDREDVDLSEEDRRDLMRRLVANARKLDRILANLLDLERLMRGTVEASRQPTSVDVLVRQLVADVEFLRDRPVHVVASAVTAAVDAAKLERILENLLLNAVKHTPEDTPIWVRVERAPDGVLIAVEDAGPGVPEAYRESIFEPFQQGPGGHPAPGTGIGLSLVSRFAALHGGRAWVQERDGGGSSFRVWLPDAERDQPPA